MLVFFSLLFILSVCVYALRWPWRRQRRLLSSYPSLPTWPIIGNAHWMLNLEGKVIDCLQALYKLTEETGSLVNFYLGPIIITGGHRSQDIKKLSNAFPDKPYLYSKISSNWAGQGLISGPIQVWKQTSKKLVGAFSGSVVEGYQDMFNDQARRFVDSLKTEQDKEPFDVLSKYVGKSTLVSIYKVVFGDKESLDADLIDQYYKMTVLVSRLYTKRALNPLYHLDSIYRLTPSYRELIKSETFLNSVADKEAEDRKRTLNKIKEAGEIDSENKSSFRSYLDQLLKLGESDPLFSPKQIRDELNTVMFAGHDTLATATAMSLLMIGSHPRVQDALYAEMRQIFGDSTRPVTKDDLSRMPYCTAVINETLRLFPSVPVVLRQAHKDLDFQSGTIPKGTMVYLCLRSAGRETRSWGKDVEQFRPERWLDGSSDTDASIPFSTGKRSCIGKTYAIAYMKTIVAHCTRELELEADTSDLRLATYLTIRPVAGHLLRVRGRRKTPRNFKSKS